MSEWFEDQNKFDEGMMEELRIKIAFDDIVYGPRALRKVGEMIEAVANLTDAEFEAMIHKFAEHCYCWGDGHGYADTMTGQGFEIRNGDTYTITKFDITNPLWICQTCRSRVMVLKFAMVEDADDPESEYDALKFAMARMRNIMRERLTNLGWAPASQSKYQITMNDAILAEYLHFYLHDSEPYDLVSVFDYQLLSYAWRKNNILQNWYPLSEY